MRGLLMKKWFWVGLAIVLGGLAASSWYRSELEFLVIYVVLGVYAAARAYGWRSGPRA